VQSQVWESYRIRGVPDLVLFMVPLRSGNPSTRAANHRAVLFGPIPPEEVGIHPQYSPILQGTPVTLASTYGSDCMSAMETG
jgi:hypothetical protein